MVRGPATIDAVVPVEGWQDYWPRLEEERRRTTPWLAPALETA
jgi:hypothetical protein